MDYVNVLLSAAVLPQYTCAHVKQMDYVNVLLSATVLPQYTCAHNSPCQECIRAHVVVDWEDTLPIHPHANSRVCRQAIACAAVGFLKIRLRVQRSMLLLAAEAAKSVTDSG